MLKIRLQRVGRKHEPSFRLVLTDSKNSTKSGRFKELLGSYDPRKTNEVIKIDRVKALLAQGVSLTDTVHNLLVTHKIIDAKKKNVLPKKTYTPPAVEVTPETPVEESVAPTSNIEADATSSPQAAPEAPLETPVETPTEDAKIDEAAS